MILLSLHHLQMEAATADKILENPIPPLSYITDCWISSIRNFLRQHQIQIQISEAWNFNCSRRGDEFLMDVFRKSGVFSASDLRNLNAVRMFLQVATISDIATADGKYIDANAFSGKKNDSRPSPLSWCRQPKITPAQSDLWTQALQKLLTTDPYTEYKVLAQPKRLRKPLGQWLFPPNQKWKSYHNIQDDKLFIQQESATDVFFVYTPSDKQQSRSHRTYTRSSESHKTMTIVHPTFILADLMASQITLPIKTLLSVLVSHIKATSNTNITKLTPGPPKVTGRLYHQSDVDSYPGADLREAIMKVLP